MIKIFEVIIVQGVRSDAWSSDVVSCNVGGVQKAWCTYNISPEIIIIFFNCYGMTTQVATLYHCILVTISPGRWPQYQEVYCICTTRILFILSQYF